MKPQIGIKRLGISIIIIILICYTSAAITSTSSVEIVGNVADSISLTLPSNIANWNFHSGSNNVDSTLAVNSNNYWGVNVKSDQSDGKLKEYRGAYISGGRSLKNPMHIECKYIGSSQINPPYDVTLTDQDQSLIPSNQGITQGDTSCGIEFSQLIDSADSRVTAPNRYHISITIAGYISY